jgi:hypothetical protein
MAPSLIGVHWGNDKTADETHRTSQTLQQSFAVSGLFLFFIGELRMRLWKSILIVAVFCAVLLAGCEKKPIPNTLPPGTVKRSDMRLPKGKNRTREIPLPPPPPPPPPPLPSKQ